MGEHLGLQWTWRLLNVFPKSCALNNSCRRVAFSMHGCKLYTSLFIILFLFLFSSIDPISVSSGMEKRRKIKWKLEGREETTMKTKHRAKRNWFLRISWILKWKIVKEEEGIVKGGKKYSFDFVKFEEIVGNYSTFTIENLFISENNAAVKFITSADT